MATTTKRGRVRPKPAPAGAARAFRGLLLVYLLSSLSLAGVLLTIAALGGLGRWSAWQFIGAFGLLEAGSGFANIISPNMWRLPVSETQTRKTPVKLSARSMLLPHWGGGARSAAGLTLMVVSAVHAGVGPGTTLLPLLALMIAIVVVAASALVGRFGVWRPDLDVIQLVIRRAGREHELEPVSIGASSLQFLLSIATIPFVKAFAPGVLFQPEFSPSFATCAGAAGLALAMTLAALVAWRGRIDWSPPRGRRRAAQRYA